MPVLSLNEAAVRSQKALLVVEPRMIRSVPAAWLDTPGATAPGVDAGEVGEVSAAAPAPVGPVVALAAVVAARGGPDGPMQPTNTPAPSTAPEASKPRRVSRLSVDPAISRNLPSGRLEQRHLKVLAKGLSRA